VALAWIGYRLLTDGETEPEKPRAARSTFQGAIRTIIVADATMGLDNVLGVAGAAHGSVPMVALGLVLSIPIVVWGSTLLLGLLRRFPGLLYIGGAVLAWTAVEMFVEEPLLAPILGPHEEWTLAAQILVTSAMLGTAWLRNRRPVSPYGVQISPAMHSAQSPAKAEI
jgi:predicted tellurium resistance membrane protein TerC